ncbi:MAG: DUF664 domain-containing protein [Ilumatobacteraceae bacterium]
MESDAVRSPVERTRPTERGGELATLTQMLDFLRATMVVKTEGLSDAQASSRPVPASELILAGTSLDEIARSEGMDFNLRYALVHMIEETARHCGHADLLRESIDGARGQ